jgi:hypothetical protein
MATTATAIQSVGRVRVGFVLAIEGYEYLLCDTLDTGRVVAAWGGTGWSQALPGLKVRGTVRQTITPWPTTIDVPTLTFEIQADEADTFGIAVWKSRPSFKTRLSAPYAAAADGSGIIDVIGTLGLPAGGGADAVIHVGSRRIPYSATTATTITVDPAQTGTHHPFSANTGLHYSQAVSVPSQQNWDAAVMPVAQSVPQSWIGKRVALYLHRIVGEVWDIRAQAQLEFAGQIVTIDDDPKNGATILGCEDLRGQIRDCVLLERQWVGHVRPGIKLQTGDTFHASEDTPSGLFESGPLTVVAGGATGNDEINAGYFELEDFIAALNRWIANAGMGGAWTFGIDSVEGAPRFAVTVDFAAAETHGFAFFASSRHPLEFLGFFGEGQILRGGFLDNWKVSAGGDVAIVVLAAKNPAFLTKPFQTYRHASTQGELSIDLESSDGQWISHTQFLPAPFDAAVEPGEDRSFVRVGDRLFFATLGSATRLDGVGASVSFGGYAAGDGPDILQGKTIEDGDEQLDVFQVVVLASSFATLVTSLLASTDGRGVNHTDFDIFSKGMGCPGIPWSLLGDDWLDSVKGLDQVNAEESLMVVLDKPRKLIDLLLPELVLRFAWFVFKNGGYRLTSPPTPNPIAADHVLDETNKAAPADQTDQLIAMTAVTKEHLCNVIKVEYNRTPAGEFRDTLIVRDETSISTYGETQACSITAPNSYSDAAATGVAVEALAASLVARVVPAFGRPLKTVRRSIAPTLYHMAPGDTVSLSDDLVRDPDSGRRPLISRACICMGVSHSFGHEGGELFGEVELLFTDEDRTFPLAPAVDVDTSFSGTVDGITFTLGYAATAAGGPALKTLAHTYSLSAGSIDPTDVSRLSNGDLVHIYEIDPPNTASIVAWDRQLAASVAVDAADNYVRLTADLASPAYNTTKEYRIVPQKFSQVAAQQKLVAYLAGPDEFVEDLIQHNNYAEDQVWRFARTTPDAIPYRLPADEADDEGRPLHAGLVYDHIANINGLVSYVAASHAPAVHITTHFITSSLNDVRTLAVFPFAVGLTPHSAARRYLIVQPILSVNNAAATANLRVTSSKFPPRGANDAPPVFTGPKKQHTFTRTGSTAEAAVAGANILVVPGNLVGITWITIEIWTSGVTAQSHLRGFQQFHLGPVNI